MTKTPSDPFEKASYDLNLFRERRIAERRQKNRNTPDRRKAEDGACEDSIEDAFPPGMH